MRLVFYFLEAKIKLGESKRLTQMTRVSQGPQLRYWGGAGGFRIHVLRQAEVEMLRMLNWELQ